MSDEAHSTSLPPTLGGQAVVEGVMIRGPQGLAVAVRRPDGEVAVRTERNQGAPAFRRVPVLRGVAALGETLSQGMRAFVWSAQIAAGREPVEPSASQVRLTSAMSLAFAGALFLLGPSLALRRVEPKGRLARFGLLSEGVVRIGTVVGYLRTVGRLPQAQRLFAYHGAEHRAIQAYEAGEPLEVESLHHFPNAHVRCGTSFLLTTSIISSLVYAAIGPQTATKRLLSRIVLMPVIAGVSYEAIRLASTSKNPVWGVIFRPNMALQNLTTRDPDEAQMEVALAAVKAALALHRGA
jgi:uncharacterized protein YqhQ